jgi:GntR family transcriptional regulator
MAHADTAGAAGADGARGAAGTGGMSSRGTYNPVMTDLTTGIDVRSFEPYYQQLKRILVHDIETSRDEGDLLPSESEMCRLYSVSRTVVRQALAELEDEGLVLKVKGKGTYVTGRKLNTSFIQHSLGFYESMLHAGHTVRSEVLSLRTEPCSVSVAKLVEIGVGDEVVRFDRVRSVDGRRVQVVRTVLPARMFPGLAGLDMTDRSLYQVLADSYGVRPSSGHRAIDATPLSGEDAHHLHAPEGSPALRIESVTRTADNVPFEYYVAIYRGDSFKFEFDVASP